MKLYEEREDKPVIVKLAVLAVVALFALIGLLGLLLPVIPGVLFLGLAALLLSKVSHRFSDFLDQQPHWRKVRDQLHSSRFLTLAERTKLALLWAARGIVNGIAKIASAVGRRTR
jgi:uncharacterized membrane protein YbaN (DUF454 family)